MWAGAASISRAAINQRDHARVLVTEARSALATAASPDPVDMPRLPEHLPAPGPIDRSGSHPDFFMVMKVRRPADIEGRVISPRDSHLRADALPDADVGDVCSSELCR